MLTPNFLQRPIEILSDFLTEGEWYIDESFWSYEDKNQIVKTFYIQPSALNEFE